MKLIKVSNGLLEAENFFLVSPFSDFAGETNVSRDISTGKLSLISNNNKIERSFKYENFVIDIEKEKFNSMAIDDYSMIYISDGNYSMGIKDQDLESQKKYWKLLKQDGYVQAYTSDNGLEYTNIGGMAFMGTLSKQGFIKNGSNAFILSNYEVYSSPYITLQNFDEGTICELYDVNSMLLKTRTFDSNMGCKIFLDSKAITGYLIFKDINENVLYTSDVITIGYGDTWIISPYNFEINYLGATVTDINPALLQDLDEIINIKNIGSTDYAGIIIGTTTSSNDLIQLSLDGETYASTVSIDIAQSVEVPIYLKITKNADNHSFKLRDFQLVINE